MSIFLDLFPKNRRHLLDKISGSSIFAEMTQVEFKKMLVDCLTGENPRIKTETWAQAKVFHGVFSGLKDMFEAGKKEDPAFIELAPTRAAEALYDHYKRKSRLKKDDVVLCQWICNLTQKGYDNILQGNPELLKEWASSLTDSVNHVPYGERETNLMNIALYNASIAKKGGLKSAFGNLFEHLLLFSSLSSLGLKFVPREDLSVSGHPAFSLDINDGRQCDARIRTGLSHPLKIDIDIGFIGKGNPEIIADKTQRFANLLGGGEKPLEHTIIIVSAIPEEAQLVVRQASILGAKVITMSGNHWLHELYNHLANDIGISGLNAVSADLATAKHQLDRFLPAPVDLISRMPRNLEVPEAWLSQA